MIMTLTDSPPIRDKAGEMISGEQRWHSDYGTFTGPGDCSNGLIMWLPVLEVSHPDSNGMMVATR